MGEFRPTIRFVVMITRQAPLGLSSVNPATQIAHQRAIVMQRMNRASTAQVDRHALALAGAMKRHDCERNRLTGIKVSIDGVQLLRRSKPAGVVVANAKFHFCPVYW